MVTRPPVISVDSDQHYLYLGMADLVTFNVSGAWTEAGVRVGDQTFRAWPMPGGKPGILLALRLRLEHAAQHRPRGLCLQRCRETT